MLHTTKFSQIALKKDSNGDKKKDVSEFEIPCSTNRERIALIGGSYDPPTRGHIGLIAEIRGTQEFDEVWVVPCGQRKDKTTVASPYLRYQMLKEAIIDFFGEKPHDVKVIGVELNLPEALKTYDLMHECYNKNPASEIYFCIGSDLVDKIHTWYRGTELIEKTKWLILNRKNIDPTTNESIKCLGVAEILRAKAWNSTESNQSSTEARKRLKGHDSEDFFSTFRNLGSLLSPSVLKIIKHHGLYS